MFAFIDDMSRLIPHAEFYLHERLDSYTDAIQNALSKRGLPRKLYVDNAPAFRSQLLAHATASLGIALIHSKAYQPVRGKHHITEIVSKEQKEVPLVKTENHYRGGSLFGKAEEDDKL